VDDIDQHYDGLITGRHEPCPVCYDDMERVCKIAIHAVAHNPNEDFVKDAVADALCKTWQTLAEKAWPKDDNDRTPPKFRQYLRTAAKRTYWTLCRDQERAARLLECSPAETLLSITCTEPPSFLEKPSPEELFDEALHQMDPQDRVLIILRICKKQTQEAVAKALGLKLGSMTYYEGFALTDLKQIYVRLEKGRGDYE
jgi:RNA polymerase sigma factor (sigma-70 family)